MTKGRTERKNQMGARQEITTRSSIRTDHTAIAARFACDVRGQALIETALFSMVLVLMLAMAANFAYVAYIAAGITSASRQASVYAAQGQQATAGNALPAVSAACSIAANEVNGWIGLSSTNWSAYAASAAISGSSWANSSSCAGNSYSNAPAFNADPESAYFTINAVKVSAALNPPIAFKLFGKLSLTLPTTIYGRSVYMRQLN
jgi:Flp pilus assembly protein TadG